MSPQDLVQVLRHLPPVIDPHVLVGTNTMDDAAVFRLNDDLALVQTVDFITPVVDEPFTFGAIAVANALSDLYAMGATPLFALNLVGFPARTLPLSLLEEILRGGAHKAAEAGVSIVGGHSIEDFEPKYGISAAGVIHPDRIIRNSTAEPGDILLLTKPLGLGILTTALDRGVLDAQALAPAVDVMTALNQPAAEAMKEVGVHACTDISGYGLLGHLHEMAQAGKVGAKVSAQAVPVLEGARDLAAQGVVPEGSRNNHRFLTDRVAWGDGLSDVDQLILCDAQTSGGLLMAVSEERVEALEEALVRRGVQAARIGCIKEDVSALVTVVTD